MIGDYANVIIGNIGNTRFVGGNVAVSGQINTLGNVVAPFHLGNVIGDIRGNVIGDIRGNVIGDYANVIIGNIGNTQFVGGNIAVSGQVNVLGNVVARTFRGNVVGNLSGVFANVTSIGAVSGNISGNLSINQSLYVTANIFPSAPIVWEKPSSIGILTEFRLSQDSASRYGLSQNDDAIRMYTAPYFGSAIRFGRFSTSGTTVATDFLECTNSGIYNYRDTFVQSYLGNAECNVSVTGQVYSAGNVATASDFIGNNIQLGGQAEIIGNVFGEYYFGNIAFASGGAEASIPNAIITDVTGNLTGVYANVSSGNIGNVRIVGGNVSASGQINTLGNIVAPIFLGNVNGDIRGNLIGDTRIVGGNLVVSGQINTLGNIVAPIFLGNVNGDIRGNLIGDTRIVGGNLEVSGQLNVLGNIVAPIFQGYVLGNYANIGNVRMEAGNILANRANIANVQLDASNVIAQYYRGNGSLLEGLVESARYLSAGRNTTQTISSGTWSNIAIVFDSVRESSGITYNSTTGVFTLEAGVTYRVSSQLGFSGGTGYTYAYRLVESVSSVQVGPAFAIAAPTSTINNTASGPLDMIFTPSATTDYRIRTTENVAAQTGEVLRGNLGTYLNIVSVSSKPIVSQGGWTKVTDWNFGASTTAPTLATSATRHYAYAVTGKMMSIKGFYNQTATTGASAGSGEYLLAIPGGYQINTTTTGVATVGDVLEIPIGQTTLSTGTGNRSSGVVLAYDSGNIKFANWSVGGLSSNITTIGSAFLPLTSSALYSLYFTAEIPLL